jgi:hypothetical protein
MKIERQIIFKILIHVVFPILLGVLVYHFLTDRDMFMNRVLENLTGGKGHIGISAPDWVKYNLPDGLWTYSFASAVLVIHDCRIERKNILWVLLAVCIPLGFEFGQKFGILQGTYDPLDTIWFLGGSFASILILTFKPKSR